MMAPASEIRKKIGAQSERGSNRNNNWKNTFFRRLALHLLLLLLLGFRLFCVPAGEVECSAKSATDSDICEQ